MPDFEQLRKKYPKAMILVQLLWVTFVATIFSLIIAFLFGVLDISKKVLADVFTFPQGAIPEPYNYVGVVFIPVGFFFIIWGNYGLLWLGRISFRDREPMQRPSSLVVDGPYRFTRNPIYLGCLVAMLGFVIVCSSVVVALLTFVVYIIFRYLFIKKEEVILEEEFGQQYRDLKKRVRRWF